MRMRAAALVSLAVLALASVGCEANNPFLPSETLNVPFSTTDLVVGTGTEATVGRRASVNYSGWLYSTSASDNKGKQFDSGSLTFQVGTGVVPGFSQGVVGMKVGGKRRVVIPPALGYGNQTQPNIPANSTLLFEIELTQVQ